MFGMKTAVVLKILNRGMDSLENVKTCLLGHVGSMANTCIHTLFAFYHPNECHKMLISAYVASALAAKGGKEFIKTIIQYIGGNNKALQGWLLEI